MISELGSCPTRSNDVYFANNEQALLAFSDLFCFTHAKHNLIKFILYKGIVENMCHPFVFHLLVNVWQHKF